MLIIHFITHSDRQYRFPPTLVSPCVMLVQGTNLVVEKAVTITCPYKGAALALQTRAKQLYNTVYALKQHIHVLREASRISIKGHQAARSYLELPSSLLAEPPTPDQVALPENGLLSKEGLRTLIDQLATCEEKTAEYIQELYDPETALVKPVVQLNKELVEINILLHKNRLAKAQHEKENKVCTTASEITQTINNLNYFCGNLHTADPFCDPYYVCKNIKYRLKMYFDMEKDYAMHCLWEQEEEKKLEKNIFRILQEIPLEHEKIMSPLMGKSSEILGTMEKTKSLHALTDWTAFENRYPQEFSRDEVIHIELNDQNHPDEDQFNQFQRISLHDLEIYHKLRRPEPAKDETPVSFETKLSRARQKLTPAKHDYARRGRWSVSIGGHLIEYDSNEHKLLSMFNLRKCKLGDLAPDKFGIFGYFILRGQKVHEPSDKKKHRRKRNYKFRAPWENIKLLHEVLSEYCKVAEEKEITEDEGEAMSRAMSGDTVVNSGGQPRAE